jgi:hypothetical protein
MALLPVLLKEESLMRNYKEWPNTDIDMLKCY